MHVHMNLVLLIRIILYYTILNDILYIAYIYILWFGVRKPVDVNQYFTVILDYFDWLCFFFFSFLMTYCYKSHCECAGDIRFLELIEYLKTRPVEVMVASSKLLQSRICDGIRNMMEAHALSIEIFHKIDVASNNQTQQMLATFAMQRPTATDCSSSTSECFYGWSCVDRLKSSFLIALNNRTVMRAKERYRSQQTRMYWMLGVLVPTVDIWFGD